MNKERLWIKDVQSTVTNSLSFKKSCNQLGIVENEGTLVCLGRLERSDLSSQAEHSIYFLKTHRFPQLVLE